VASVNSLRAPTPPKVGWFLLLLGGAVLVAAVWTYRVLADRLVETEEVARREVHSALERANPATPAPPTGDDLRVRQAMVENRLPWMAALRTIESATRAPVYLRSLRFEPAQAEIRLEADAPSFAEALAYVEALDQERLIRPAFLTAHHEVADAPTPGTLVRFSVTTRWNHQ